MSYKERSTWVSLGILLYIWFNYFTNIFSLNSLQELTIEHVNQLLLDVIIITIALEVILQIVIAIIDNQDANYNEDERDKLISLHGYRYAYFILTTGVILAVFYTVFPTLASYIFPSIALPNSYLVMHLIIVFALCAEITNLATKIFYYRRGF